jgi:hypothetical protein
MKRALKVTLILFAFPLGFGTVALAGGDHGGCHCKTVTVTETTPGETVVVTETTPGETVTVTEGQTQTVTVPGPERVRTVTETVTETTPPATVIETETLPAETVVETQVETVVKPKVVTKTKWRTKVKWKTRWKTKVVVKPCRKCARGLHYEDGRCVPKGSG